jgi:[ribosomal protein S18]-alanine N-acetyltransferase
MDATVKTYTSVHIRWLIRRDLGAVLAIEHASFEYPWTEEEFLVHLRRNSCIGMVAEHGEQIVGFTVYELHEDRLHVLDFATHPESRRRGVGTQMVAKLLGKLSHRRRTRITLAVRETNLAALLFFRGRGFLATDVLRERYTDTREDAYMMEYLLDDDEGRA